jgi:hypothetical protein
MAMIHVNRGATDLGAFPEDQVREGLRAGRFLPGDLGWREGMASWQPLSQFSEFAADISAVPAAPGPPPPQAPATPTITPSAAGSTPGSPAPRSGLPWDQRQEKGFFNAFIETLQMVLSRPADAFTAMKREGGLGDPLIYLLIGGTFGFVVYFIYRFVFQSLGFFTFGTVSNRNDPFLYLVGMGVGGFFFIILAPFLVALGAFVSSAILHVCLMIVGGAKQSFETTFRVVCFSSGSVSPLFVIPFCGVFVVMIWGIVLRCIGLARAHETDTGRAVLAVFLPLIVCCVGGLFLAMMIGGLGTLIHHANQ